MFAYSKLGQTQFVAWLLLETSLEAIATYFIKILFYYIH